MQKVMLWWVFISFPLISFSQEKPNYLFLTIPKEMLENSNVVLRNYEETFTVESKGKGTTKVYYAYTILNKEGEEYAELSLSHDKFNSIKSIEGRLYDAFGKQIDRIKKSELKEENYIDFLTLASDNNQTVAKFSRGEYPYTVEFSYEISHIGLFFYPVFNPQSDDKLAIEKSSFEVIMPAGLKLRYKEINMAEKVKTTPIENNKTSYKWVANNITVKKREKLTSSFGENPMVYTGPTDFEIEGYSGNMNSWESFGSFINQLNNSRDVLPEATQNKIRSLVAKSPTKYEKIKTLYEYMQSKTRYVSIQLGIGGWQPMPAQTVDEKGYGDCKALSNYMKSLLKIAGIESYYTLVRAGTNAAPVLKDFPSNRFNHAILCVPIEKDTVWLECTSQTESAGFLGNFTDDRYVLIATPQGGKLIKTQKYHTKDNTLNRTAEVTITASGDANIKSKTVYSGLQQDANHLDYYSTQSKNEQKKYLNEHLDIPQFDLLSFNLDRKKDRLPSVTETLDLQIKGFGSKSGKRIFISPNIFNKFDTELENINERKSDITLLNYDYIDSDTIIYHLPENYHLEGVVNDIQYKSAFGEYTVKIKIEQGLVTYIRTFAMKGGKYPKEKYKELVDFYKNVAKSDKMKIVLVSNT